MSEVCIFTVIVFNSSIGGGNIFFLGEISALLMAPSKLEIGKSKVLTKQILKITDVASSAAFLLQLCSSLKSNAKTPYGIKAL